MGLYVYVKSSNDGLPITNASFSPFSFSNNGGGEYFVYSPTGAIITVTAPNYISQFIETDDYVAFNVFLAQYVPPHSSHSNYGPAW